MTRSSLIFGFIVPRILIVLLWASTNWFHGVLVSTPGIIFGTIFMPTTLLWFSAVHNWFHGDWGGMQFLGLIVAALNDFSPLTAKKK